ncbi:hypothetical protein I5Q34_03200 [Streptomyces sp. AV19]|nr:hypothetical protein [Streptomyces sp. AV19]MBH1933304.1 hypothetical protein [Streptomyces sp. AV19]MDG4531913.1 hypothetical protein [Streptomyces sp. AV19]
MEPVPVPVHLTAPAPADEPEPVPGCDVCVALVVQRTEARRAGDLSRAVDCNVELRQHPHGGRR